jgi:Pyruvate/2-oxoacid:ferredoxin oxidoreductase delta subunit
MTSPKYREMNFYTEDQIKEISNDLERAVTIPVNIELGAQHRVYDFSEVKDILRSSQRYAVQECGCKRRHDNCDSPRDICLAVNQYADEVLNQNNTTSKEINFAEALDVIRRSHEAGLVPMAYVMKGDDVPFLICNCCPCCCHTLGSLVRKGLHTEILTSKFIAEDDDNLCNDCGECVERCVFQAREIFDGNLHYDSHKCFGCGLCVSICPTGAIHLTPRSLK